MQMHKPPNKPVDYFPDINHSVTRKTSYSYKHNKSKPALPRSGLASFSLNTGGRYKKNHQPLKPFISVLAFSSETSDKPFKHFNWPQAELSSSLCKDILDLQRGSNVFWARVYSNSKLDPCESRELVQEDVHSERTD